MSTFREYLQKQLDTDPEFREWWELRCQLLQSDLENVEELLEAWIERERPYFLAQQVAGSMALSGMDLTEEDKERIRLVAKDPDAVSAIVKQLIEKHKA